MSKIILTETRLREMIYESINNALNENAVDEGRAQALWNGAKAFVGPRQDGQSRWDAAKQAYRQEMYNTGQRWVEKYGNKNNNGVTDPYRNNTSDTGSVTQPPTTDTGTQPPAEQSQESTIPQDNKTPVGPHNKTTSSTGGNGEYTEPSQTGGGNAQPNAEQTKTAGNNQTGQGNVEQYIQNYLSSNPNFKNELESWLGKLESWSNNKQFVYESKKNTKNQRRIYRQPVSNNNEEQGFRTFAMNSFKFLKGLLDIMNPTQQQQQQQQ